MKKLFLFLAISFFVFQNAKADFTEIDFAWAKRVKFKTVAIVNDRDITPDPAHTPDGSMTIRYVAEDECGYAYSVSITLFDREDVPLNGTKTALVRNAYLYYDKDDQTILLQNCLEEDILLYTINGSYEISNDGILIIYDLLPLIDF